MFSYNDEYEMNIAEIKGVLIACEEVEDDYEELAQKIADKYPQKLDEIVQFLIDEGICEYFGDATAEKSNYRTCGEKVALNHVVNMTYL